MLGMQGTLLPRRRAAPAFHSSAQNAEVVSHFFTHCSRPVQAVNVGKRTDEEDGSSQTHAQ